MMASLESINGSAYYVYFGQILEPFVGGQDLFKAGQFASNRINELK